MAIISAEKRQQILQLAAEGHSTRHIHRTTGIDCETIRRYRNGYTPPPKRDPAAEPHCRNGHPYPENLRTHKDGWHYCHTCTRDQKRASRERTKHARNQPKPAARPTQALQPVRGDWRNHAACLDEAPELFFPIGKTAPALLQAAAAKAVCYRCPVLEHCAAWALNTRQEHGVWGGYDERQRRSILRKRDRRRTAERKNGEAA